jgi:hypothetical protein
MCTRFGVCGNRFTFGNFTSTQVGVLRTNTEGNAQPERPQLDPGLPGQRMEMLDVGLHPGCIILERLLVERDRRWSSVASTASMTVSFRWHDVVGCRR